MLPLLGWAGDALVGCGCARDGLAVRKRMMQLGTLGVAVYAPMLAIALLRYAHEPGKVFLAELVFAGLANFASAALAAWEVESWRHAPRATYTGVALAHNLAQVN